MQICLPDSEYREDQQILLSLENSAKAAHPKINYVELVHCLFITEAAQ